MRLGQRLVDLNDFVFLTQLAEGFVFPSNYVIQYKIMIHPFKCTFNEMPLILSS